MQLTGFLRRYDGHIYIFKKTQDCLLFLHVCFTFWFVCVCFKSSEVKYLTLHSVDEVLDLFTNQEKEEAEEEDEDEWAQEDWEESHFGTCLMERTREESSVWRSEKICAHFFFYLCVCLSPGKLDDEVAASVYDNRGVVLDMDSVTQLTFDNFHTEVAQSSLTVALFYLKCKTRSHCCSVKERKQMNKCAWNYCSYCFLHQGMLFRWLSSNPSLKLQRDFQVNRRAALHEHSFCVTWRTQI